MYGQRGVSRECDTTHPVVFPGAIMKTKDLEDALLRRTVETPIPAKDFLSTGSALLNLACSGRINGGIPKGTYVFMPGQSGSGKTWISLSIFAEAKKNKHFKDYRLIRDDTERGSLMNIGMYFGQDVKDSIENLRSPTVEEFYYNVDEAIKKKKPFIYVLDSMEGLSSEGGVKHFEESKKNSLRGKQSKGSYAGSLQKTNSQFIRIVANKLQDTGSILIITGQTRHNMGLDAMFKPEIATGGDALLYWAHLRVWCRKAGKMKRHVNGKDRKVGDYVRITVDKSRISGKERTVKLRIPNDFGIDDTGSMIEYLMEEKKDIIRKELKLSGDVDDIAEAVEGSGRERELRRLVRDVWNGVEEQCVVRRKPRYG